MERNPVEHRSATVTGVDPPVAGDREVAYDVRGAVPCHLIAATLRPGTEVEGDHRAAPTVSRSVAGHLGHGRGGHPKTPARRVDPHAHRGPESRRGVGQD